MLYNNRGLGNTPPVHSAPATGKRCDTATEREEIMKMYTVEITDLLYGEKWTQLFYEDKKGIVGVCGTLAETFAELEKLGMMCEIIKTENR